MEKKKSVVKKPKLKGKTYGTIKNEIYLRCAECGTSLRLLRYYPEPELDEDFDEEDDPFFYFKVYPCGTCTKKLEEETRKIERFKESFSDIASMYQEEQNRKDKERQGQDANMPGAPKAHKMLTGFEDI